MTWRYPSLAAAAGVAIGLTTSEEARAEARSVEIVATGDAATTSATESLVRELLQDAAVDIRWTPAHAIDPREVLSPRPADAGLVARVWVNLSDPRGARLFVSNAASDHFLVRIVPAAKGDEDKKVETEAVAQIVSSAVEALLAGGKIGVARDVAARQVEKKLGAPPEVPEEPPEEPTPRAEGSHVWGETGAFLAFRALGSGSFSGFAPGLMGTLVSPRRWPVRPILIVTLQYDAPRDWPTDVVGVRLEGGGGTLQAGLRAQLGNRVSFQASFGLGAEATHVVPQAVPNAGFTMTPPFWLAAAVLPARIGVEFALTGPLSVFAAGGGDIDLSGVEFNVSARGTNPSNVVVPWRVWPVALLGASLSLGGDRPPAP